MTRTSTISKGIRSLFYSGFFSWFAALNSIITMQQHNTYDRYCLLLLSLVRQFCPLFVSDREGVIRFPILALQTEDSHWRILSGEITFLLENHTILVITNSSIYGTMRTLGHILLLFYFFISFASLWPLTESYQINRISNIR